MSEFTCQQGHLLSSHEMIKGRCYCGARICRMDGMSGRELAEIDKEWDRKVREQEEEEEEKDASL